MTEREHGPAGPVGAAAGDPAEGRRRLRAIVVSVAFSVAWSLIATAVANAARKRADARRAAASPAPDSDRQ